MRWKWLSRATPIPAVAALVPDAEVLRRSALAASWRRDRWVGRRRLWWRWLLWALPRYVAPLVAALLLIGWLAWLWAGRPSRPNGQAALATTVPLRASTPHRPPRVFVTDRPADGETELPVQDRTALPLRLDGGETPAVATPASVTGESPPITPTLKPENWLHSKEP